MTPPTPQQPLVIGYASRADFGPGPLKVVARKIGRNLLTVGASVLFASAFLGFFVGGLYVGVLACLITASIAAAAVRAARRRRAMVVLAYIEQAIRLHLPLPGFLRVAATGETRPIGQRLRNLADTLEATAPLGDALAGELPELPVREAEVVRVAERNGTLRAALARLTRDARWRQDDDVQDAVDFSIPIAYFATYGMMFAGAAFITFAVVLPRLNDIMRDFGVARPASWRLLDGLSPGEWTLLFVLIGVIAVGCALRLLCGSVATMLFPAQRRPPYAPDVTQSGWRGAWAIVRLALARLRWHLPLIGAGIRDRDWADTSIAIGEALAMRRPLDIALREAAAQRHLSPVTVGRLERWSQAVEHGTPTVAAARAADMPALFVGLLGNDRAPVAPEVFEFLGRHYRSRATQRSRWLASLLMPAMTLVGGALVVAFALFIFVPLWSLIEASIPTPYRVMP